MDAKKIPIYSVELFVVLLVLLFFGLKVQNVGALFNSDALYLPILLGDLLSGGRLADWYLTPSPYLFPDFILFYLISIFRIEGYWSIVSFAVLQVLIYSSALRYMLQCLSLGKARGIHAASIFVMIFAAVVFGKAYQYILISAHHFSVVIVSIIIFCIIFKQSSSGVIATLLAMALSFLMGLSDSLYIVQFSIPLAVTVVVVSWIYGGRRHYVICGLLFLSSVLGYLAYSVIIANPMRYNADIGLAKFLKLIRDYSVLSKVDRANFILLALVMIVSAAALVRVVELKKRLKSVGFNQGFAFIFAYVSIAINSLVVAITTNLEASDRYFIPVAVLSSIGLAFYLIRQGWSKSRWLIASLVVLISVKFFILYDRNGLAFNYEIKKTECLNSAVREFSLKSGIAEYWDAKKYQFLIQDGITLAQFTYDNNPYLWITSSRFFNKSHTFALISEESVPANKINYESMVKANGVPSHYRQCEGTTLYVYDKPIKFGPSY